MEFTNEYPWRWSPAHVDEWSLSLTGERHLAPSTIRTGGDWATYAATISRRANKDTQPMTSAPEQASF